MKKALMLFGVVLCLSATSAFAGSGKAIVPHWAGDASNGKYFYLWMSNVTDHDLQVQVQFFSIDGTLLSTNNLAYQNWTASNTQIAPHNTAVITVSPPSNDKGYAVISWSNIGSDDDAVGLVAHGARWNQNWSYTVGVNQGSPF